MTDRMHAETHYRNISMLNSIIQSAEYIKRQYDGDREFFIQMAILNLERAAKDISARELEGIGRLRE